MKETRLLLGATTALTCVLLSSGVVHAQETQDQPAQQAAPQTGIGEIIVTAQRREESLQRAAVPITAISTDDLERAGVDNVEQLSSIVPALQITNPTGSVTFLYLRGVGNFTANSLSDAAVSVNLDGVPIARSSAVQGMMFDLERVEVLKGPQGTLYGRNATGGAINIITAKPEYGFLGGYVNGEYGNYDALTVSTALNLPLGDNAALRVAANSSDRDGYMSDGAGDAKMRSFRAQLGVELSPSFELLVGADYSHAGGIGPGVTVQGLDRDDRIGRTDPRAAPILTSTLAVPAGSFLPFDDPDQYQDNNYFGVFAQADIKTPLGDLTILPSFREYDLDFQFCAQQCVANTIKGDQTSVEVRLASDLNERMRTLLGFYYLHENTSERLAALSPYTGFYPDLRPTTDSYAGFVRLEYQVTDAFRVSLGGRYTVDDKRANLYSASGVTVCPTLAAGTPCIGTPSLPLQLDPPQIILDGLNNPGGIVAPYGPSGAILLTREARTQRAASFEKFTYRIGLEYDLSPTSLLYATYETGFKSGGFFNTIEQDEPTFDPETIQAFTLGSKNRFLNNALQVNLEAFWWEYKDRQVAHFAADSLGGTQFITENIGESRMRGVEVDAIARIGVGTTLRANVQYLDAKNTSYIYENIASAGPPVTGCPFALSGAVYVIDCSGTDPENAPEWTLSAGLEQVFQLGGGTELIFNADGRYQTSAMVGFEQLPAEIQDGYFTGNLQLKLQLADPDLFVAAFVNNVTDANVASSIFVHPNNRNLFFEALRPPRTYGMRVGIRF